ncbi:hypothetical protein VTK56DRAFT_336 [Thermocarpiscus australiensis]
MPPHPKLPPPAEPQYRRNFDPWNSVSTGHQRREGSGPQGWRESRNMKMNSQFRAGNSGGQRVSDTVGAGSEDFDERLGMLVPKEVRARAVNSVAYMLRNPGTMRAAALSSSSSPSSASWPGHPPEQESGYGKTEEDKARRTQERKVFGGLVVYVNGSTHPLVSDHKLKRLLAEHGARMSIHMGRRQVTHVILGKPSGPSSGAGGGLAGGKLEKEIRRIGGCGIKYVGVEWVLESIKAGKRLPEARFANLKIAARSQQSVLGAFSKAHGSTQQPPADHPGG